MQKCRVLSSLMNLTMCLGVVAGSGIGWAAAVPETIVYQGMLDTAVGTPVSGQRSITFRVYDHPSTGEVLWSETQSVAVANGRFNVVLGVVNPIVAAVFAGSDTYLGIQVESDDEMVPRQKFSSVAYAMRAGDAETLNGLRANEIQASGGDSGLLFKGFFVRRFESGDCVEVNIPAGQVLLLSDFFSWSNSTYMLLVHQNDTCTGTPVLFGPKIGWNSTGNWFSSLGYGLPLTGPATYYLTFTTYVGVVAGRYLMLPP